MSRGGGGAGVFKGHSGGNRALPASRRIWYALWYRHFARATAWRRARLEDEGLAAQPLASLLICGARALLRCAAALPLADEPFVGLFGMTGQLDLPITQRFDIVSVGRATFVAFPGRLPGLQLHGAQLAGDQRRACLLIVGALGQQMPAQDGQLACPGDRRDLRAATGADAQKEGAQRAWRFGRSPSCLDQHGTGMRTPSLADATMLCNPETGFPHPRAQADIADQLLRTGESGHLAACRHVTGGAGQID